MAAGDDEGVDDDVVDEIRPHGGGISEIAHLHRRRPTGCYRRPGVMGVALEIDEDVDLVRNVNETVERGTKPRAHRGFVIGTIGIGEHFEAVAVVALEQFGHQPRRGMLMKISGQIAEANALLLNKGLMVKDGFRRRRDRPDPLLGAEQLIRRGRRRRKQVKRRNPNPSPDHADKLVLIRLVSVPLARMRAMINELAERIRVIGPETQGVSIGRDRTCEIAEFARSVSQIVECLGEIGLVRQRLFKRHQRFAGTPFRQ